MPFLIAPVANVTVNRAGDQPPNVDAVWIGWIEWLHGSHPRRIVAVLLPCSIT
jgi:hypothetical protein